MEPNNQQKKENGSSGASSSYKDSVGTKTHESNLGQHTANFYKKASDIGHDVADLGSITKELAGDAVEMLQEHAGKYQDQFVKKAGAYEKNLEKTIKDNPLTSLLIATSIGLIAGAFLNRR